MASAGSVRAGGAFIEIYAKDTRFQQALARVQAKKAAQSIDAGKQGDSK